MSDHIKSERHNVPAPDVTLSYPPLPPWLARHLLRPGEEIVLVRGPLFSPWWERYLTHPVLFLHALALGALFVGLGWLMSRSTVPVPAIVAAALLFFGSIFVLGFTAGYFTRLVVTSARIVVLQGWEIRRSWGLDDLPFSLIRYDPRRKGEKESRTIDLDTVQILLGDSGGQFTDAKTIWSFTKQLARLKDPKKDGEQGKS
jgi:hypothetical protein